MNDADVEYQCQQQSVSTPKRGLLFFASLTLSGGGVELRVRLLSRLNNLQQHSTVLLKGVKVKDLIGVHLTPIRGKFDLMGVTNRKTERSVYGVVKH